MFKKNNVNWNEMDSEWKERIRNNFWSVHTVVNVFEYYNFAQYSLFRTMRDSILDYAGQEVCDPFFNPNAFNTQQLACFGKPFSTDNIICEEDLIAGQCHENATLTKKENPHLDICFGFYMDNCGFWRSHSWNYDPVKKVIIERTQRGQAYWGITLDKS